MQTCRYSGRQPLSKENGQKEAKAEAKAKAEAVVVPSICT